MSKAKKWRKVFAQWLSTLNYEHCEMTYPGAVHATELVDDFLDEYADSDVDRKEILNYAKATGWVSDYAPEVERDEDDVDDSDD